MERYIGLDAHAGSCTLGIVGPSGKRLGSAGERPNTVIVEERRPGGSLYGRVWNASARGGQGNWSRKSLKHSDKERAKTWALEQAAKLTRGDEALRAGKATLEAVFAAYEKHRTPRKTKGEQKQDARPIQMWKAVLGGEIDPHNVSLSDWERFIDLRSSGAINPRGRAVAEGKRHAVRDRTVEADCNWLRWVFTWAVKWRAPSGHYLMRENPVRGFEAPKEQNVRRPVATHDRFLAIRNVSDQVMMESRWGKHEEVRSYLSELLDIVNGTGRRISAVCKLRYEDLRLDQGPHDSIRWPAQTDKTRRETIVPISPGVRSAIDRILRERPGIGSAPLFPAPGNAQKPISRHLADRWLRKAEELAGIEPHQGSAWHAYRRKWATERKHLPDVDVAEAGGWKTVQTLKSAYQRADVDTMLRVVLEAGELREAR
jgi:integrase